MGRGGKERRGKILQAGSPLIIKHLWSERLLPWGGGLRSWVIGTGYHLESGDKSKCRRWGTSLWQRAVCADAPCPVRRRAYVLPPRDIINTCSHTSYTHALAHTHTHTHLHRLSWHFPDVPVGVEQSVMSLRDWTSSCCGAGTARH